jgi:proteic killer suppression protein
MKRLTFRATEAVREVPYGFPGLEVPSFSLDVIHASRYYQAMIASFRDGDTEALAEGQRIDRFASFESAARRKLMQLEIAGRLDDLRIPPGNRLEALKGDRAGQYSIRINDRYRVCFRWLGDSAEDVEITDYH